MQGQIAQLFGLTKLVVPNTSVTVVVVNIQNLMDGLYATLPGSDEPIPFGEFYGAIVDLANLYIAALSPYSDTYNFAYIGEDGEAEKFLEDIKAYNGDPTSLRTAITDCFDVYDNDMFAKTQVLQALTKILAGEGLVAVNPEFSAKYDLAALTDLKKFSSAVYDNAIYFGNEYVGYLSVQDFLAYGKAGELDGTPYGPYYDKYESALLTVYDTAATFMKLGATSTTLDLAAAAANFSTVGGDILDAFFAMLIASMENPGLEVENTPEFQALANDPTAMAIITLGVRSDLGNSFFSHPNENGHQEIADAIMNALENNLTGLEFVKM